MSPSVSVVVPVGAVDDLLPLQLDALAAQEVDGSWELVLSLNTDDKAQRRRLDQMVEARPAVEARIVDSSDRRSASHARNVGARAAASPHILFCDGDDLAAPGWIAALGAALEHSAAVGGHLEEARLAIAGQEHWRPPATPGGLPTFLGHPFLVTANMAITREAFERVGGFDLSLIRGEDIALSWDLLDAGVELAYAPDAVVHYRHRRGLGAMMRQHYLYGRGLSQVLARQGEPGGGGGRRVTLRANAQPVAQRGYPYYLRRGSIAAGRLVGLVASRSATLPMSGYQASRSEREPSH